MSLPITLKFEVDKDTKNTRRYAEVPEPGKPALVGTLYVQKWAATPDKLTVVISAAD
jgi:hypothetical protein